MERRRQNVTNFGSAWLKPPGVPKTLFQMREERREAEEHAEAMRREQELAAQLAEAEAEGADELDDEQMADGAEEPDLDDEIPEAEGFGFDGDDSGEEGSGIEEEEEDDDDDDETDDEVDETDNNAGQLLVSPAERDMQATEDRVREVMSQGQDGGGLTIDDDPVGPDNREQMLEEDDLIQDYNPGEGGAGEDGMDMDMDADLDDDIPSADGRYEHTDSEADISDEDESTRDVSYASAGRAPQASRFRRSLPRSSVRGSQRGSLAQSDIDFSGLLSRDESSYLASSPQMRRRG